MAKKIKIEITEAQLSAIIELVNYVSAMVGCSENDKIWLKQIKLVDRMLSSNGFKRQYK